MQSNEKAALMESQKVVVDRLCATVKNNRVGHAYIFDGERGTGKKRIALFYAKLLLCEDVQNLAPCENCHSCRRIDSKNHPNVKVIQPDGQNIRKEQMDQLIMEMTKKGYEQGRKIYIITQAERMNIAAANALLKYLEEPESEVTAILLTDSYTSILPTIQSRCQRLLFLPPSRSMMIRQLTEKGVTVSMASTVTMITADIQEAFKLSGDDVFAQMRKTVLKLMEALDQHVHEALLFIQSDWSRLFKEKEETDLGLDLLLYAYQDIAIAKANLKSTRTFPDKQEFIDGSARKLTYSQLSAMMEAVLQAKRRLHGNMNRTLLMEQLVLNLQEGLLVV